MAKDEFPKVDLRKFPKNQGKNPAFVKLYRCIPTEDLKMKKPKGLACLEPDAINNRFVASTGHFIDLCFENLTREAREDRERRARAIMEKKKCSHRMALAIVRREDNKAMAIYNSPLKVAERRIKELEDHLQLIKEVVNDPNYLDRFD